MDNYDSLPLSNLYSKGIFGSKVEKMTIRARSHVPRLHQVWYINHLPMIIRVHSACKTITTASCVELLRFPKNRNQYTILLNTNLSTIYDFPLFQNQARNSIYRNKLSEHSRCTILHLIHTKCTKQRYFLWQIELQNDALRILRSLLATLLCITRTIY